MTTSLLEVREYIRNFYVKYEEYIVPVLKFVLALISLLMINEQLGYMSQLNNMAAVLVVALVCSFMPKNFILFVGAGFVTLHLYEVSLECAVIALLVFLLMFLLYFRFSPDSVVLVIVTPHAVCAEDSLCRSAAGRTACQSLCRGDGGLWGSDILSHYLYECECIHIGGIPGGVYDPAVP